MPGFAPALFLVVSCNAAVYAQYSEQLDACLKAAETQVAMTVCSSEEATRADAELNDIFQKLLAAAAKEQAAAEKIRHAEEAWRTYRDAFIEAMYPAANKQSEYGSIFPMEVNLLRAKLTRQQVLALRDLLKRYAGPWP